MSPVEFCKKHDACDDGAAFAARFSTLHDVWANCQRVDWLLWMLAKSQTGCDRKYRKFACWRAEHTPGAAKLSDPRSIAAVRCAERYADGDASDKELSAARSAAWAAARSAAWAAWAAWAAASAQCDKLRELFGSPFDTAYFNPLTKAAKCI